jgi:hypothetical protein
LVIGVVTLLEPRERHGLPLELVPLLDELGMDFARAQSATERCKAESEEGRGVPSAFAAIAARLLSSSCKPSRGLNGKVVIAHAITEPTRYVKQGSLAEPLRTASQVTVAAALERARKLTLRYPTALTNAALTDPA